MRMPNLLLFLVSGVIAGSLLRSSGASISQVNPSSKIFRLNLNANVPQAWETNAARFDIGIDEILAPEGQLKIVGGAPAMLNPFTGSRLKVRGSAKGIRCLAAK